METTDYFRNDVMVKRPYIKPEWIELALASPAPVNGRKGGDVMGNEQCHQADEKSTERRKGLCPSEDRFALLGLGEQFGQPRANTIVVPGARMDLAMQIILTPLIMRLMDIRRAQHQ